MTRRHLTLKRYEIQCTDIVTVEGTYTPLLKGIISNDLK